MSGCVLALHPRISEKDATGAGMRSLPRPTHLSISVSTYLAKALQNRTEKQDWKHAHMMSAPQQHECTRHASPDQVATAAATAAATELTNRAVTRMAPERRVELDHL
jgi:hypothetical protein